ncbi:hypothetical protein [Flavobacterium caseinilyticum]|uniref:Uncharacterized protein n=1 Tax=Flavobacterium caseinilyticum TaxID=2541732 RepID=A0A4R5AVM9_9FLAO|nr:hypothetical protein [Flavobacterium caseinilyticum]TDD77161.1 hypothetical protein E0F89_06055 [Flavobacterium caseinilyticum]
MEKLVKKSSLRSGLNRFFRMTQRIEITKLPTNTVTVRNVYKNKQIIEVTSDTFARFNSRI